MENTDNINSLNVHLQCYMVLEGTWGMKGEPAGRERCVLGVDWARPGASWEPGQLVFSACHLLAMEVRMSAVLLMCRKHLCKTAGMVAIKIMAAVYRVLTLPGLMVYRHHFCHSHSFPVRWFCHCERKRPRVRVTCLRQHSLSIFFFFFFSIFQSLWLLTTVYTGLDLCS